MKRFFQWWCNVNLKTRFISIIILIISILMGTFTFVTLRNVQNEARYTDFLFCKDFSVVFVNDIYFLIEQDSFKQLQDFVEKIYLTTSNIYYIRLFNVQGDLILSFPMNSSVFQSSIQLSENFLQFYKNKFFFNIPNIYYHMTSTTNIINCIIPLIRGSYNLGFIQLGFCSGKGILLTSKIIQSAIIIVFVCVWLMFILGATFNFLIIAEPIKKLLIGFQGISSGNFNQKIDFFLEGQLSNLIISFNEMSDRLQSYEKKHVAQLTSEKAKLETLISTIADGAVLLDTELRLLFVNQIAVKVFHWSNKDLIGHMIFKYLPAHVNEALLPVLNSLIKSNCLDDRILQAQELVINLHDESLKTFRFLLSTVLNDNSRVLSGIVIIIQDITRETELNGAKNQFISNVSHELRTPLCNIGSFLETLIDYSHKLTDKQKSQFLSIAYAETQRLNRLVNDILDLSRLESEYNYILKPVVLFNTIAYIVQASQIIVLNKKVQIIVEIHQLVKEILANESSLCQVLSNLISNSLKFTHQGGRIIIRAYPLFAKYSYNDANTFKPEIVRLEVIDEGIGIDKMLQRQVFDRFMRIENNIHMLEGTGLGLSIVKNIVEKHNSIISVYSEVGIGTSFWFDLFMVY